MHKAICSECGKECVVPFVPTGNKPVFCSNCFEKKRGSDPRGFGGDNAKRPNFRNSNFENKPRYDSDSRRPQDNSQQPQYEKHFEALNAKLDKILKLLSPVSPPKIVEEEKITNEIIEQPAEQTVVTEKKKRASKKPTPTPEE